MKFQLENAESLEERKGLRLELRELRQKIFDTPSHPTPTKKQSEPPTSLQSQSVNVAKQNAKNLDLNGNKVNIANKNTLNSSSINSKVSVSLKTSSVSTTGGSKMNSSSVTRRSRLFDDNNNATKSEPPASNGGIKLKVNVQDNDEVPALRTRDPADRAARRARRAQQQREMSIDSGLSDSPAPSNTGSPEPPKVEDKKEDSSIETTPKTVDVTSSSSITVEKPKDEKKVEIKLNSVRPTATTSPVVVTTNSSNINNNSSYKKSTSSAALTSTSTNDRNTGGSAALRRSVTWGAKDRPGAANSIGKALNKFGGQVIFIFFCRNVDLVQYNSSNKLDSHFLGLEWIGSLDSNWMLCNVNTKQYCLSI